MNTSLMNKRAKILIASAVSVAVVGGVGVTLAYADPSSPSPAPGSSPSASPPENKRVDKGERRGLLRRALHGEVTLAGEKQRVVVFQRGQVTQVSATAVAVRSEDGYTATYELTTDLRVRKDRNDAKIADVKVGTAIRVLATKEDSTLTARRIRILG